MALCACGTIAASQGDITVMGSLANQSMPTAMTAPVTGTYECRSCSWHDVDLSSHARRSIRICREDIAGACGLGCARFAFARDFAGFAPTTSLMD